jgi:hypothetical protein
MISDNLPDGAGKPIVFKFNTSMMPILMYAITADESYPGLDKILEENVTNVLNRVDAPHGSVQGWVRAHVGAAAVVREPHHYKVFLGGGHLR